MDVQLDKSASLVRHEVVEAAPRHPERQIAIYWLISVVLGAPILRDWLATWNVGATLASPLLVIYLCCSFALSQALYVLVARHGGRPVHTPALAVFALGNGFAETLAFVAIYRIGENLGTWTVTLFAPGFASIAGFVVGVIFFAIYGGLIHGLFWLRVLPPHLDDNPLSRKVRNVRPIAEVALVLGWSLCLWLYKDIWTVVFFHTLVDIGLMLLVRPAIFGAPEQKS